MFLQYFVKIKPFSYNVIDMAKMMKMFIVFETFS